MNAKQQLKRQLRKVETSLAPLVARLTRDGCKARVMTGQNGSIGIAHLVLSVADGPVMAAVTAATVAAELAELGLSASHETFPMPGRAAQIGLMFEMTVNRSIIAP